MTLLNCYRCGCQPCECRDGITLYHADCRDVLPLLEPGSVDLVLTDPPYGIGFMGKEFDTFKPEIVQQEMKRDTRTEKRRALYGGKESDAPSAAMAAGRYDRTAAAKLSFQAWCAEMFTAILPACKPGAMLASFGGTRTYHRLTCGIEDAGWEVRDCLMWLYGSGFPKSLDVSKAIDKAAGVEREVVSEGSPVKRMIPGADQDKTGSWIKDNGRVFIPTETAAAKTWDGYGTALKPAWEPVVLAMKPLDGTFAENAIKHGVAGINVDEGRVGTREDCPQIIRSRKSSTCYGKIDVEGGKEYTSGRWPANLILQHHEGCVRVGVKKVKGDNRQGGEGSRSSGFVDTGAGGGDNKPNALVYGDEEIESWDCHPDCPIGMLDGQSGTLQSGTMKAGTRRAAQGEPGSVCYGIYGGNATNSDTPGDTGTASRFFYCAKASGKDRGNLPAEELPLFDMAEPEFRNTHPTVKPLELMRYLLTLLYPPSPDAVCLDPFAGSGTTGVAAKQLGRKCILIEKEQEHCATAARRLEQEVLS